MKELTGNKIGDYLVIKHIEKGTPEESYYKCQCLYCGASRFIGDSLLNMFWEHSQKESCCKCNVMACDCDKTIKRDEDEGINLNLDITFPIIMSTNPVSQESQYSKEYNVYYKEVNDFPKNFDSMYVNFVMGKASLKEITKEVETLAKNCIDSNIIRIVIKSFETPEYKWSEIRPVIINTFNEVLFNAPGNKEMLLIFVK